MKRLNDAGLIRVLDAFGIDSNALLGQGGESRVFALDDERIARVNHPGTSRAQVDNRTAVLDFGASVIIGDRRLDPLTAAVYLTPAITPTAIQEDHVVAQEWLAVQGLASYYTAAQNWIAAYWSFATDDISLYRWCRKILVD